MKAVDCLTKKASAKNSVNTIVTPHFLPILLRQVWEQHFKPIYALQDDQRVFFDTPEDMLQAMGMYNLTQYTCEEHMKVRPCAAHAMLVRAKGTLVARCHGASKLWGFLSFKFVKHHGQKSVRFRRRKGEVLGCAQK